MKVLDCEQGTPEWDLARLGIPTASCFDKILTPGGKPSTQADAYMHSLLAEWLTGLPSNGHTSDWMQRGAELEAEALDYYTLITDREIQRVGFVLSDCERWGCSPDALCGEGGVEIKVPAPHTHVAYLLTGEMPLKYKTQVQGNMLVTAAPWWDWMSYAPGMPHVLVRVERDEEYIEQLRAVLETFTGVMETKRRALLDRGALPAEKVA